MNLDAGPILARKRAEDRRRQTMLSACLDAEPILFERFRPFEKFCGKPAWTVSGSKALQLKLQYPYRAGCGTRLAFKACLEANDADRLKLHGLRTSAMIADVDAEGIAAAFVKVLTWEAEQAFDAIVYETPWHLAEILKWR